MVGVCRSLQLKPNSKEGSIIMIVGLTGVVGCRNFIYAPGASGVVITGFKQVVEDFNFSVGEYMFHNLPHVLYALLFVFILTKLYKMCIRDRGCPQSPCSPRRPWERAGRSRP